MKKKGGKKAAAPAEVKPAAEAAPAETKPAAEVAPKEAAKLQLNSDPNCNSFECFTHHTLWEKAEEPVQYPISTKDTIDPEILSTQQHIATAEKKLGKTWKWTPEYNVFADLEE